MTKAQEYRDQSVDELGATLADLRKELFELRNGFKQAQKFEQPHLLNQTRKSIARALTVLREKEVASTGAA